MKCLFCNAETADSKSVEHIIPQSFGNSKMVLKRGIVCDKCNNYFGLKIEGPFLSKRSSILLKREVGLKNKKGRIPIVEDFPKEIENIRHISRDTFLYIDLERKANDEIVRNSINAFVKYNAEIEKDIIKKDKETSRLLAKMSIEYFVYSNGQTNEVCDYVRTDSFFQRLIKYVRYDSTINWDYNVRRYYPLNTPYQNQLFDQINYECDLLFASNGEIYFVVIMFGVEYVISMNSYSTKGYKNWLKKHDYVSPLYLSRKEREAEFKKYARKMYNKEEYKEFTILINKK